MVRRPPARQASSMTPSSLTPADFDELVHELERLRAAHREDLARQLRDARSFGSPGDDDDWLTVMEVTAIDRGRIAQLERLVASATVVDAPAGRTLDYELVGRRSSHDPPARVSLNSPVGKALTGSQPGDVVQVELPSGRPCSLSVIDVRAHTGRP
jgi:transcription elongation factor GreA